MKTWIPLGEFVKNKRTHAGTLKSKCCWTENLLFAGKSMLKYFYTELLLTFHYLINSLFDDILCFLLLAALSSPKHHLAFATNPSFTSQTWSLLCDTNHINNKWGGYRPYFCHILANASESKTNLGSSGRPVPWAHESSFVLFFRQQLKVYTHMCFWTSAHNLHNLGKSLIIFAKLTNASCQEKEEENDVTWSRLWKL